MTEDQYIKATNRVKISTALTMMRNVLSGDNYGISDAECSQIRSLLAHLEAKLIALIEIEEE